jgi:hypothetical protein
VTGAGCLPGRGGVGSVVQELLLPAVARFAQHGHVLISERGFADGAPVAAAGAGPAAGHRWEDQIAAAVLNDLRAQEPGPSGNRRELRRLATDDQPRYLSN